MARACSAERSAEGLAAAGATVAIVGRSAERGEARVDAIIKAGGRAEFFEADAINDKSLASAHQAIETAFGPPTVLVNAAGGNDPKVTGHGPIIPSARSRPKTGKRIST